MFYWPHSAKMLRRHPVVLPMNIEEDKNYVTSYAFGVSPELIGKPLASASRRFWSIFIDFIIVSSLTLMSTTVMAICVFLVSLIGFKKARNEELNGASPTMLPRIFIVMAVLSVVVILASVSINSVSSEVSSWSWSASSDDEESEVDASKEELNEEEAQDDVADKAEESSQETEGGDLSFIAWVQAALSDLGLGFGWAALYFSVFTAWFRGQTIGKMLLGLRVMKIDGKPISLWESFGRYGGYSAGLATGLLGFMQIMWDPNRQAIHDKISETVVLNLRKPNRVNPAN